MTDFHVIHNQDEKRFEVHDCEEIATLTYDLEPDRIVFLHTEVPPVCEGRGIGSGLARAGLEYARSQGLGAVVLCKFMRGYVNRHPEYHDLIREPWM